ncbi:MAG: hypothetical protein LBS01_11990 [Prevotellaceae bacterium]|jgi:Skp family chaperone for outer membrane proteins|nr:hypothetical protein [Prevotellaceae bacterium]
MKKTFLLLFALAATMLAMNAQEQVAVWETPKSYESNANLDKKTGGACVSINVSANEKTALTVMENLLKKEGLKGKTKGKTLLYEKTVFPAISTDYINIYVGFVAANKDKKNPQTTVNVFVSKGISKDFVNSAADVQLITNLKNFLDMQYAPAMYNNNVEKQREAKQKEIDKSKSDLDNLAKTVDKRQKDIKGYEKDIEKANENIKKANSDIETSQKQTETTKALLQKLQEELKTIK